jgi:hypothetical protein
VSWNCGDKICVPWEELVGKIARDAEGGEHSNSNDGELEPFVAVKLLLGKAADARTNL